MNRLIAGQDRPGFQFQVAILFQILHLVRLNPIRRWARLAGRDDSERRVGANRGNTRRLESHSTWRVPTRLGFDDLHQLLDKLIKLAIAIRDLVVEGHSDLHLVIGRRHSALNGLRCVLSSRNLKRVGYMPLAQASAYDILWHRRLLITKAALAELMGSDVFVVQEG